MLMKKISQILENNQDMIWEVKVELSIFVPAANEGEASFLAQESLESLEMKKEITITQVSKKDLS